MSRGSEAKKIIMSKILETFENSFLYNDGKEIRIPIAEGGDIVQIKVTLTAAKVNVECGADTAVPTKDNVTASKEITEEEKKETVDLLKSLNF